MWASLGAQICTRRRRVEELSNLDVWKKQMVCFLSYTISLCLIFVYCKCGCDFTEFYSRFFTLALCLRLLLLFPSFLAAFLAQFDFFFFLRQTRAYERDFSIEVKRQNEETGVREWREKESGIQEPLPGA